MRADPVWGSLDAASKQAEFFPSHSRVRTSPKPVQQILLSITCNASDSSFDFSPLQLISNSQPILDKAPEVHLDLP
jgi:hypothetical protein